MTDSQVAQLASSNSIDQCLHQHRRVVQTQEQLRTERARFQRSLATASTLVRLVEGSDSILTSNSGNRVRESLESTLSDLSSRMLDQRRDGDHSAQQLRMAVPMPDTHELEDRALLILAEDLTHYLNQHAEQRLSLGVTDADLTALKDLQFAFALSTGVLLPAPHPQANADAKLEAVIQAMDDQVNSQLDALVFSCEDDHPEFVADYRTARGQSPSDREPASQSSPSRNGRGGFRFGFRRKEDVSLPS